MQLFLLDSIPNSIKIRLILVQYICRKYHTHPFTTQLRGTAIYKTNDIVDLNSCTRKLKHNDTIVVCCNNRIHSTRIQTLTTKEYQKHPVSKTKKKRAHSH